MAWMSNRRGALAMAAATMLAVAPAMAQTPDSAGTTAPATSINRQIRSYSLRNLASKPIVEASAHMTNGATANITEKGRIMPNQSQSFGANNGGCVDTVTVKFADGTMLPQQQLKSCDASTIVVRDNEISLTSSATPGAAPPKAPSNQ